MKGLLLICGIMMLAFYSKSSNPTNANEQQIIEAYVAAGKQSLQNLIATNEQNDLKGESFKNKYVFTFEAAYEVLMVNGLYLKQLSTATGYTNVLGNYATLLNDSLQRINASLPAGKPKIYLGFDAKLGDIVVAHQLQEVKPQGPYLLSDFAKVNKGTYASTVKQAWDAIFSKIETAADLAPAPTEGMEIIRLGFFSESMPVLDKAGEITAVSKTWCLADFGYRGSQKEVFFDNIRPTVYASFSPHPPRLRNPDTQEFDSWGIYERMLAFAQRIRNALNGNIKLYDCQGFPNTTSQPIEAITNAVDLIAELKKYEELCFSKLTISQRVHVLNVLKTALALSDNKPIFTFQWPFNGGENIVVAIISTTPSQQADALLSALEQQQILIDLIGKIDDGVFFEKNYELFIKAINQLILKSPTLENRVSVFALQTPSNIAEVAKRTITWDKSYFLSLENIPAGTQKYTVELIDNGSEKGKVKIQKTVVKRYEAKFVNTGTTPVLSFDIELVTENPILFSPFDIVYVTDNSELGLVQTTGTGPVDANKNYLPAVFLKYAADKRWNADAVKAAALTFDGVTLATTGPAIAAIKGLKVAASIRKALVVMEVANAIGAAGNITVNNLGADGKYAQVVQAYNGVIAALSLARLVAGGRILQYYQTQEALQAVVDEGNTGRILSQTAQDYEKAIVAVESDLVAMAAGADADKKQAALALLTLRKLLGSTKVLSVSLLSRYKNIAQKLAQMEPTYATAKADFLKAFQNAPDDVLQALDDTPDMLDMWRMFKLTELPTLQSYHTIKVALAAQGIAATNPKTLLEFLQIAGFANKVGDIAKYKTLLLQIKDDKQFLTNLTTFVKADAKLLPDFLDECLFNPNLLLAAKAKWTNEVGAFVAKLKSYANLRAKIKADLGTKTSEFLEDFSLSANESLDYINKIENLDLVNFWKNNATNYKVNTYPNSGHVLWESAKQEIIAQGLSDELKILNKLEVSQPPSNNEKVMAGAFASDIEDVVIAYNSKGFNIAELEPELRIHIKYLKFIKYDYDNKGNLFTKLYQNVPAGKMMTADAPGIHAEVIAVNNVIKQLKLKNKFTSLSQIKVLVKGKVNSTRGYENMCRCPHCHHILNGVKMINNK